MIETDLLNKETTITHTRPGPDVFTCKPIPLLSSSKKTGVQDDAYSFFASSVALGWKQKHQTPPPQTVSPRAEHAIAWGFQPTLARHVYLSGNYLSQRAMQEVLFPGAPRS